MKRKLFLLGLVLVVAIFLSGCSGNGGPIPPVTSNQSPIASFTANPTSGLAPLQVSLNASNSSDSDGSIVSYAWDFKDGDTGNGETINHTFSSIGSYNVKLTVTDNKGATGSTTKTISVTAPITQPVPLGTPLTKDGITVTVQTIVVVAPPDCGQLFEVKIYFSVINENEQALKGPGHFSYELDENIYEVEFNLIGYLHIGDGISWVYPGQSRSLGYQYCFRSPVTIKQITWTGTFADDSTEIVLGPWEN